MAELSVRRTTRARHDALLSMLRTGVGEVEPLSQRLGVSPSTVRRDLSRLQAEGRVARTYGGAFVREEFHERSFTESEQLHQEAKAAIAATAATLVPPDGTVFLDAGTTCLALARLLASHQGLTVVTRGLEAAVLLARAQTVDVVMLGGAVRPLSHGVTGPLTSLAFDRLAFDAAFLGADAVDPVRGLGEPTVEETYVKEQAASRASAVHVLADGSKLARSGVPAWIPFGPAWTLVTDGSAPGDALTAFTGPVTVA